MKHINKIIFLSVIITMLFAACHKVLELPYYKNGWPVILSASKTNVTPTPADSSKEVVSFTWTDPRYATEASNNKYILEIDSTGRNFSKETTRIVTGTLGISFTGKELNNILAGFGFFPGQKFSFDIRLTSSYGNNNEQYKSNVIKVDISSYLVPITLTPSSANSLVLQVSNASNTAVSFNWNSSPYGAQIINYALQFDVVGGNFSNPSVVKLGSSLTTGFTVNDLNSAAIAAGVSGG